MTSALPPGLRARPSASLAEPLALVAGTSARLLVSVVAGWIALCCPALAAPSEDAPKPIVVVVQARQACFSSLIPVTGFLVSRREAMVFLLPGDAVTEVLAAEGATVAADQVLARITRPALQTPPGVPPAPPGVPPAPAAPPKVETVELKAPAGGLVVRSTAAIGVSGSQAAADPLFRIAIDGEIELEAEVPSFHVPDLAPGQAARIKIDPDVELGGQVRLTPSVIDPRTQLGRARIFLGRNPKLRLATFARAVIDARRSCGLSVPRAAVTYRTLGKSVQVVVDGVIATRTVQIGLNSDTEVEISGGLQDGDLVVANAGTSLRDGDRVKPVEIQPTTIGER